jgi:tetratricopeptide (TPR) repeat protein
MMDHPHIAKVFDAGTTPAGRPYFVMELVRGVPITEFCDQRRFDPRRRLELFVEVCRAVQHAHQKGVIHRDLKPSNVLVTLHDTVAVPKVIDFGIAKATSERLTERTLVTHFAQMVGTPLYMSPEQAEMNGLDVDTRSDVYALGVLLYELLTGTTPFGQDRLKAAGCDEVRRILREEEPPRPSRHVATLGAAAVSTVAEQRGVDARQFGQLLRGDLDWIVMKALEKDRNRRYESASAFAQDMERYLAGEAVEARPPSAAYRLRKFAGRNKATLVATIAVAVSLLAATGVSVWQATVARVAQRQAVAEAAVAKSVKEFLQYDLFRHITAQLPLDGEPKSNPTLNARKALDQAAAQIDERFRGHPLVEAEMRLMVGTAFHKTWDPTKAVPHLERAVALRAAHLGRGHRDTLLAVHALEMSYEAAGRLDDALDLLADWWKVFQATFGTDGRDAILYLHAHSIASYHAGKFDDAERSQSAILEIQRKINPRPETVNAGGWLSRIYLRQERYKTAEAAAHEALAIVEQKEDADEWHRYAIMAVLGEALLGQEKYVEAEPVLVRAYAGLRESDSILGPMPWNWRLRECIEALVRLYEATNQLEMARTWRAKLPP